MEISTLYNIIHVHPRVHTRIIILLIFRTRRVPSPPSAPRRRHLHNSKDIAGLAAARVIRRAFTAHDKADRERERERERNEKKRDAARADKKKDTR